MKRDSANDSRNLARTGLLLTAAVMVGGMVLSCPRSARNQGGEKLVEVQVQRVGQDPIRRSPVVFLEDHAGGRILPIWIGEAEARAILSELNREKPPRPMTHDLFFSLMTQLSGELKKVVVTGLRNDTILARMEVVRGKDHVYLDSRPSDAIALALRARAPIYVSAALFSRETGAAFPVAGLDVPGERFDRWGIRLQKLTPELAAHFRVESGQGLLLSSVEPEGEGARQGLLIGDILLEGGGKKLTSVSDLEKIIETSDREVKLIILRDGEKTTLRWKKDPTGSKNQKGG